jgi:hypothetical protein
MVSQPHEAPGVWLSDAVKDINQHLLKVRRCAPVTVTTSGAASVDMQGSSYMTPDQSLHPCLRDKSGNEEKYLQTRPAVVLETAASQTLQSVMRKAFVHLYKSNDEIKAVIVCNLTHPIPLQPGTYRAEIAVWVRELTGDVGKCKFIFISPTLILGH